MAAMLERRWLTIHRETPAPGRRSDVARASPITTLGRTAQPSAISLVLALCTMLGLVLRLYQLHRPGYLLGVTEYDDGADFGSAIRFVHGVLPYRDFITVQPPGITLLMAPAALFSYAVGTAKALAVGRIFTACAGAAAVMLGGLLVRHRGVLATTVTCGILAVFPDAIAAAHTVLLEPWLVLFCLLGAVAVFDGDEFAAVPDGLRAQRRAQWRIPWRTQWRSLCRSRVVWGGAAFGFAGAIKVWAILPVLVIAVLCLPVPRRLVVFLGGVAIGFLAPVLPFALAAPRTFLDSVIVAQLVRVDAARASLWTRLSALTGLTDFTRLGDAAILSVALAIAAVVVGCCAAASLATRRPPPTLEAFALISTALVVTAFLWPDDFYYHYAGFFAPFLALAPALPLGRCAASVPLPGVRWWSGGLTCLVVLTLVGMSLVQTHAESLLIAGDPAAAADRVIPPGACVLTDTVSLTVAANRFDSDVPGCSAMVDGVGTDYTLSHGLNGVIGAGAVPAVESAWLSAFEHAQYVWLSCAPAASPLCGGSTNRRIPWTPAITAYFFSHFEKVTTPGAPSGLYERYTDTSPTR